MQTGTQASPSGKLSSQLAQDTVVPLPISLSLSLCDTSHLMPLFLVLSTQSKSQPQTKSHLKVAPRVELAYTTTNLFIRSSIEPITKSNGRAIFSPVPTELLRARNWFQRALKLCLNHALVYECYGLNMHQVLFSPSLANVRSAEGIIFVKSKDSIFLKYYSVCDR